MADTCLLKCVPPAVPGAAFLSGGQSPGESSARLTMINAPGRDKATQALTFSCVRALQGPPLANRAGNNTQALRTQAALLCRARCNGDASRVGYEPSLEREAA